MSDLKFILGVAGEAVINCAFLLGRVIGAFVGGIEEGVCK